MKKTLIILGIIISLSTIIFAGIKSINNSTENIDIFIVKKQNLQEVISEIGKVIPVKEIDLTFPLSGNVDQILIKEGATVKTNEVLAYLNTNKTTANLANALAQVQEAKARLNQLYSKSSKEEIKISETKLINAEQLLENIKKISLNDSNVAKSNITKAEITLKNEEKNLSDQKDKNTENLKQSYQNGITSLENGITKAYTSLKIIKYIEDIYFTDNKAADLHIEDTEEQLEKDLNNIEKNIKTLQVENKTEISTNLKEINIYLENLADLLSFTRKNLDDRDYLNPTINDKGYLNTERNNINTAISQITSKQQAIASTIINNSANLNLAQGKTDSARENLSSAKTNLISIQSKSDLQLIESQGALNLANDQLSLIKSGPQKAEIDLYKAQLEKDEAYVTVIKQDIEDSTLKSPIDGIITKIHIKSGELATIPNPIITISSQKNHQIECFISELDIAKINTNNKISITFDAFTKDNLFEGKVIEIDGSETNIDSDIFYKVLISITDSNQTIRAGMTANLKIQTAEKKDILVIPSHYIGEKDNKELIKTLEENNTNNQNFIIQEIKTGLTSINLSEVTEGLKEGTKIIPYY